MSRKWKRGITAIVLLVILVISAVLLKMYFNGKIDSVESLQEYIKSFGIMGPVVLTLIQAAQVVVPILPGFLGCAVGATMFGPVGGFFCNYIGICAGSIISYFLARKFGLDIVLLMFSEKHFEKWNKRIQKNKSYDMFLFIATLLPLFPDDFLCYFSGLIDMNKKKFIWIILLGKPWCILAYSIIFGMI